MAENRFEATARIPSRPFSMANKELAYDKEVLVDYEAHTIYLCIYDNNGAPQYYEITPSIKHYLSEIANYVIEFINNNPDSLKSIFYDTENQNIIRNINISLDNGTVVTISSGLIDALTRIKDLEDALGIKRDENGNITSVSISIYPSQIITDENHLFITESEKQTWNNGIVTDPEREKWNNASDFVTSGHTHSYYSLTDIPEPPEDYKHPETHPASMITGLAKVATSGNYNDLINIPEPPIIPESLPANGGNADTVDGKHASDFATINGWVLKGENIELPITGLFVRSAAYGNNMFVATNGYHIVYSTDGINWTTTSEIDHEGIWNLCYGNGIFVAISDEDSVAAYSTDGINWIATTTPLSTGCSEVTFGNGKFVAVKFSSTAAAYSTDGINWSSMTMPSAYYSSVVYGADKFVAMGTSNYPKTYAAVSTDGISWTEKELSLKISSPMLAYCNEIFVAVNYSSTSSAYSQDGVNWTSATVTNGRLLYGISSGNGKILIVGSDSDDNNAIFYSTNGKDWNRVVLPFPGGSSLDSFQATTVIYGNNRFLAFAGNLKAILYAAYSKDVVTWIDKKYIITQDGVDITENVRAAIGV